MNTTLRPPTASTLARIITVSFWGLVLFTTACAQSTPAESSGKRYALLVGCTKYPYCDRVRELYGPNNDIPTFSKLLETKFGFDRKNIQTLVGWPGDAAARPAHDNITAAFDDL